MEKKLLFLICALTAITVLSGCGQQNSSPEQQTDSIGIEDAEREADTGQKTELSTREAPAEQQATAYNKPFDMTIDKTKKYSAILRTAEGDIELELFADKTPTTVNNFVNLAKSNFYNNTVFHRAIKGFMIQGGDPKGDGTGGPGYRFDDEPFEGEYIRGTVAMANAGPNTNGSQFFIMHADYPLPKNYVIFGRVTKGLEIVDKIAEAEVGMSPSGEMSKPVSPVKVTKIEISE